MGGFSHPITPHLPFCSLPTVVLSVLLQTSLASKRRISSPSTILLFRFLICLSPFEFLWLTSPCHHLTLSCYCIVSITTAPQLYLYRILTGSFTLTSIIIWRPNMLPIIRQRVPISKTSNANSPSFLHLCGGRALEPLGPVSEGLHSWWLLCP